MTSANVTISDTSVSIIELENAAIEFDKLIKAKNAEIQQSLRELSTLMSQRDALRATAGSILQYRKRMQDVGVYR